MIELLTDAEKVFLRALRLVLSDNRYTAGSHKEKQEPWLSILFGTEGISDLSIVYIYHLSWSSGKSSSKNGDKTQAFICVSESEMFYVVC